VSLRSHKASIPPSVSAWGYAKISLRTKKIKGLHENDFIMAGRIDRIFNSGAEAP
jgi:4a-hydroxytetrahydrobiopterin dehydratase